MIFMANGTHPRQGNAVLQRPGTNSLMVGKPCGQLALCYVNSNRTNRVSRSFNRSMIDDNKLSSVVIGYKDENYNLLMGSGTLIGPNLVLTSAHMILDIKDICAIEGRNYSDTKLFVRFDYEYTSESVDTQSPRLAQFLDETVIGIKNIGNVPCKDFALLVLPPSLALPMERVAKIANRSVVQHEDTISFQHPKVENFEKSTHPDVVTRVSGGEISFNTCHAPRDPEHCNALACVKHTYRYGSSGGGVFDKNMCLIGVVQGDTGRQDSTDEGQPKCRFVKIENIIGESKFLKNNVLPGPTWGKISAFADLSNDNP